MSTDYGRPHGTSTYGAGIERPGDGERDDDRVNEQAKLAESTQPGRGRPGESDRLRGGGRGAEHRGGGASATFGGPSTGHGTR